MKTTKPTVDADLTDKATDETPMAERSWESLLGPWKWRTSDWPTNPATVQESDQRLQSYLARQSSRTDRTA